MKKGYICDSISLSSFCVSDRSCTENQNKIPGSITFSRKSRRLGDKVGKHCTAVQATVDNIVRRMRFTWRMTKATNTHSEYVILIAFPPQQWLHERTAMLGYTHIACVVTVTPGSRYANTNHQALKWQYRYGKKYDTRTMAARPKVQSGCKLHSDSMKQGFVLLLHEVQIQAYGWRKRYMLTENKALKL